MDVDKDVDAKMKNTPKIRTFY